MQANKGLFSLILKICCFSAFEKSRTPSHTCVHSQIPKGVLRLNFKLTWFSVSKFRQDTTFFGAHQYILARKQTLTVSKKRQLTSTILMRDISRGEIDCLPGRVTKQWLSQQLRITVTSCTRRFLLFNLAQGPVTPAHTAGSSASRTAMLNK